MIAEPVDIVANLVALLVLPFLLVGTINRVKARWAGRRGPPLFQAAFDVVRLFGKRAVYSDATGLVFRIGPLIVLVTVLASACVAPIAGVAPIASFPFDFVWFAYVWGLGRAAVVLAALDTGSSFEGMGAAREATFSTLTEPVVFLVAGALGLYGGTTTLAQALAMDLHGGGAILVWASALVALLIVVQVEAGRMPVDDPTTHLELTMVHEVMVLDHSGPELAWLQLGGAIKLHVGVSLVAALAIPVRPDSRIAALAIHAGMCLAIAVVLGLVESLVARLRLRDVPRYIMFALVSGGVALLALLGRLGGTA